VPYGVAVQQETDEISAAKTRLRTRLIESRRGRSDAAREAARAANGAHLLAALADVTCVAAYLPLPTEPLGLRLLDQLASSIRVLVPVVTEAAPLDWCEYPGPVRRGAWGIDEPVGPRLGPDTIAAADVVLVPALAVDPRGHRLGRGGGHYDRTLDLRARLLAGGSAGQLIGVIYDDELVPSVPFDGLDQPVSAVVRPTTGLRAVG
jgi:5-formyltetrahydrofolate cyclo-ligase